MRHYVPNQYRRGLRDFSPFLSTTSPTGCVGNWAPQMNSFGCACGAQKSGPKAAGVRCLNPQAATLSATALKSAILSKFMYW